MRWVLAVAFAIGCEPTITDPCPGKRACPDHVCCEVGFPYHCGTQCFQQPCGNDVVTCVNVDRTDGCYGGVWKGSFTGTFRPTGGGMQSIGGELRFDINEHVIVGSQPSSGTGSIDCDTGVGSWTVSGNMPYRFSGTWMHTETQGDRISGAEFSYTSTDGSADGTWEALRIE
jgi:hypothetical protein